jgi:hypothetical protein
MYRGGGITRLLKRGVIFRVVYFAESEIKWQSGFDLAIFRTRSEIQTKISPC